MLLGAAENSEELLQAMNDIHETWFGFVDSLCMRGLDFFFKILSLFSCELLICMNFFFRCIGSDTDSRWASGAVQGMSLLTMGFNPSDRVYSTRQLVG